MIEKVSYFQSHIKILSKEFQTRVGVKINQELDEYQAGFRKGKLCDKLNFRHHNTQDVMKHVSGSFCGLQISL